MKNVIGVGYKQANIYDFVQFFKCNDRYADICSGTRLISGIFWPGNRCSNPPCNRCQSETTSKIKKKYQLHNYFEYIFFCSFVR